jgi:hypothetical protein
MKKSADWRLEGPLTRPNQDRTVAVFSDYNAEDRRVEVSIPTKMLGEIGSLPIKLADREMHAHHVLLAMVTQADEEGRIPPESPSLAEIDETRVDMHAVKGKFSAS